MKIQVVACDVDRRTPARTYTIRSDDGRAAEKDLCAACAGPLEELLGGPGRPAADETAPASAGAEPEPRRVPRGRRRIRVTTLEEIEAKKKARGRGGQSPAPTVPAEPPRAPGEN